MAENLQPTEGLFEDCVLPSEPRVGYILFVLPFGSHWQVAEAQAMYLARVHSGDIRYIAARDALSAPNRVPVAARTRASPNTTASSISSFSRRTFPRFSRASPSAADVASDRVVAAIAPFGEWASRIGRDARDSATRADTRAFDGAGVRTTCGDRSIDDGAASRAGYVILQTATRSSG